MQIAVAAPYMKPEQWGEKVGLSKDTILGMINRGQVASVMLGRHLMVDVVAEFKAVQMQQEVKNNA